MTLNTLKTTGCLNYRMMNVSSATFVQLHMLVLVPSKHMKTRSTMFSFHPRSQKKKKEHRDHDQLQDHIVMLFKLTILHRNLDSAVDMADRERSVRSAMFEMPIYNKTDKVKYLIGPSTSQPLPQEY